MLIYKKYFFDTAHFMPNFPKEHKYGRIHGHSYELVVHLNDSLDSKNDWVIDFEEIDKFVLPLLKKIDHNLINEIKVLENPTTENISKWFWNNLKHDLKSLEKIELNRPRIGGCVYNGE